MAVTGAFLDTHQNRYNGMEMRSRSSSSFRKSTHLAVPNHNEAIPQYRDAIRSARGVRVRAAPYQGSSELSMKGWRQHVHNVNILENLLRLANARVLTGGRALTVPTKRPSHY